MVNRKSALEKASRGRCQQQRWGTGPYFELGGGVREASTRRWSVLRRGKGSGQKLAEGRTRSDGHRGPSFKAGLAPGSPGEPSKGF